MAPVENRLTISEIGSTSSIEMAVLFEVLKVNRPRKVIKSLVRTSTFVVYFLNSSYRLLRVECWSKNTVSGSKRCGSPSLLH